MYVTLAARHHQPRPSRPERCDHCCGIDLEGGDPPVTRLPDPTVRAFNVLVPGAGTHQFHLHPVCADILRAE